MLDNDTSCGSNQSSESGGLMRNHQFQHGYYVTGEKVGKAWNAGKQLMLK